jgi:hypothetical protein
MRIWLKITMKNAPDWSLFWDWSARIRPSGRFWRDINQGREMQAGGVPILAKVRRNDFAGFSLLSN